jgi:hypothetical protein
MTVNNHIGCIPNCLSYIAVFLLHETFLVAKVILYAGY